MLALWRRLTTPGLGPLERSVLDALWTRGESSVRELADSLDRKLAYTTVMTTLDRLFKKGMLDRRKNGRAFLYCAKISRAEIYRPGTLLISHLVDTAGPQDVSMLAELERKIRQKREELENRGAQ